MAGYEIGSTITVLYRNTDAAGALVNVGGTVSCQVTLPDGSTAAASVANAGTGLYTATLTSTQAGRHRFRFTGTGANSGGLPWTDVADVWPTDPRLVISLDDARTEINDTVRTAAGDDELRLYIASATAMLLDLGQMLGLTILPTTCVEDYQPKTETLVLDHRPVGSVTTVVEYVGTSAVTIAQAAAPGVAGDTYTIDTAAGILTRRSGGARTPWRGEVRVTYTWGSAIIPPNVLQAARALVSHLWSIGQRGTSRRIAGQQLDMTDMVVTPAGYAVPNRVAQMLDASGARAVSGIG